MASHIPGRNLRGDDAFHKLLPDKRGRVLREPGLESHAPGSCDGIPEPDCKRVLPGHPFRNSKAHTMRVDLGVLDPEYVNALPNGHEPFPRLRHGPACRKPEWQEKAIAEGAKGLRVIASIETGQEMIQRWEEDDAFYGFVGNWISQEAVLASGSVDLFAADMNCSLPVAPLLCRKIQF